MKMPEKCTGAEVFVKKMGKWEGKEYSGSHDLVRRVDRQGEILICAGNAQAV